MLVSIENESRKLIENISDFELKQNADTLERILNIKKILLRLRLRIKAAQETKQD